MLKIKFEIENNVKCDFLPSLLLRVAIRSSKFAVKIVPQACIPLPPSEIQVLRRPLGVDSFIGCQFIYTYTDSVIRILIRQRLIYVLSSTVTCELHGEPFAFLLHRNN